MKKYISIVIISITLFISSLTAQSIISLTSCYKVKSENIRTTLVGKNEVMNISSSLLKEGNNLVVTNSGSRVIIGVNKRSVTNFSLVNDKGVIITEYITAKIKQQQLGFACSQYFCACIGKSDCDDLRSTGLCGGTICVDDKCVCIR